MGRAGRVKRKRKNKQNEDGPSDRTAISCQPSHFLRQIRELSAAISLISVCSYLLAVQYLFFSSVVCDVSEAHTPYLLAFLSCNVPR
jgi:hypothetical protein